MKTNFFADIAKNECKTCKTCKIKAKTKGNNDLSSYPTLQKGCKLDVRNVRRADPSTGMKNGLTNLTSPYKMNVRSCETEKANDNNDLDSSLHVLHNLHQKTDNSASSRVEFFDGGLSRQEVAATHHQATVPYRLNIGGRTQLVWLPEGLDTTEVLQRAKAMYSGVEVSDQPPPQGWPRLADIPEMPKAGTPPTAVEQFAKSTKFHQPKP